LSLDPTRVHLLAPHLRSTTHPTLSLHDALPILKANPSANTRYNRTINTNTANNVALKNTYFATVFIIIFVCRRLLSFNFSISSILHPPYSYCAFHLFDM